MRQKEFNRKEIEEKLRTMGDYVKIDFLSRCLKDQLDFDTRKFVLLELTKLYSAKKMFLEAANMIYAAANINTTFEGKIRDFTSAAELFIKSGNFDKADIAFERAIACGDGMQVRDIKVRRKEFYKNRAEACLKNDKRKQAMEAYEKLLTFELDINEKRNAQENLLKLYERLGKIREFYNLEAKRNSNFNIR